MKNFHLLGAVLLYLLLTNYAAQAQTTTNLGIGSGTNGQFNTHIGHQAGKDDTSSYNTFIGAQSGQSTTLGSMNAFLGTNSGLFNTTGAQNTFFGAFSGRNNTTGSQNVYLGSFSGWSGTSATRNTAIGHEAGFNTTTGGNNVFLGYRAGRSNVLGSSNVFIGHEAGFNETGSNKLYIDNSNTANPLVYGNFSSNQLGVNTSDIPVGYTLAVKGKIITEELKIRLYSTWPDYVFTKDYNLMPLKEVEQFIQKNGHLPNIPSAAEVAESGFETGEMNAKLLEKIEELTLHMIELEKKVDQLTKENAALKTGE